MANDPALDRLRAAGIQLDGASTEQRQVLASLSDDEVYVLTSIKDRLTAVDPDVEAHMPPVEGLVIF